MISRDIDCNSNGCTLGVYGCTFSPFQKGTIVLTQKRLKSYHFDIAPAALLTF